MSMFTVSRTLPALMTAGLMLASSPLHAQPWPTKTVRIVVPSAAGSAPDIMSRLLASELHQRLGQPVIAENRPGAGGSIGSDLVAKAAPDGYTLVMGNIGSHAMSAAVYPNLPYDPVRDFEAVAMVAVTPSLMTVSSALPVTNLAEFLTYARREGEAMTFSSGGNGSSSHLAGEYMNLLAGLTMRHVPYKDVAQALGDVSVARISMMISNLPPALPLVQAGRLRPLAVTTQARSPLLPEVPTMAEAGLAFEQTVWFALFAPAGTPAEVVARLNREVAAAFDSAEFRAKLAATGAQPRLMTPAELRGFVADEVAKWRDVAAQSGVQID